MLAKQTKKTESLLKSYPHSSPFFFTNIASSIGLHTYFFFPPHKFHSRIIFMPNSFFTLSINYLKHLTFSTDMFHFSVAYSDVNKFSKTIVSKF